MQSDKLKSDKKRLDWFEENGWVIEQHGTQWYANFLNRDECANSEGHATPRQAIDAAMRAEKKGDRK